MFINNIQEEFTFAMKQVEHATQNIAEHCTDIVLHKSDMCYVANNEDSDIRFCVYN